nr:hypothetical protein [Paenibacillus glucanolyticus]
MKYTVVPPAEYYQKLDTLIAANKTPDVFMPEEPTSISWSPVMFC